MSASSADSAPRNDVSVVVCTWNRATLLTGALAALVAQDAPPSHEIVVVDNNSTDSTRRVVEGFASLHPQVRYVFEARPGLSHARNSGVAQSTGAIVAFTDDDVRVPGGWVRALATTAEHHPDAAFFGGPVIPDWQGEAPRWLTDDRWNALGAQSYGDQAFRVDERRPVCLIGANLAMRRSALTAVGPFNPDVQRVHDGIGSTEDHEYHRRLWMAGAHGIYEPELTVAAVVTPDRLTRRYHRRWHFGHGRHIARMRLSEIEASRYRVAGVPAHLIRQAWSDVTSTVRGVVRGDPAGAFDAELHLWYAAGFIRERLSDSGFFRVSSGHRAASGRRLGP
jgi:glycosyltransferase involved in cell wall biosynthesis